MNLSARSGGSLAPCERSRPLGRLMVGGMEMRFVPVVAALALGLALPAWADKRLDDAVAKAERQLAEGKEDDAVETLQKASSKARRDPEASLALARLLLRLGRLEDAGAALAEAGERAASAPPALRARVLAARSTYALRAGTVEEARDLALRAVEAEAGVAGLSALARAQARAGDPEAGATAAEAAEAAPDSTAAQIASGDAFLAEGLAREAEAAYRRASEIEPGSAAALTGLARALAAQGRAAEALEAGRAATEADPHSAEALAAVGVAALAADPHDASSDAAAAVQQATFLEPKNPLVKMEVGRVFESREQPEEAAAAYEQAAGLDPTWAAPRVALLALQLEGGDTDGTLAGLRALPDEMRATGGAALLLGRVLLGNGDAAGARAALDRAVAALPGVAEAHAARGDAAEELGELTLAAEAYGRAVAVAPGRLEYRLRHGALLARDGRPEEALAELLEVTSRPEGQNPDTLVELGSVYRSLEPPRVEDAVAAYKEALKLDPRNGDAALGVAQSYRAGQQWERAISAYEHLPDVDPRREGEAFLGIAWCYCLSHDLYKARFYAGLAARSGANMRKLRAALSDSCGAR
jgi:tetratricopeptide (TPR) repeat protein